jgi:hypothetical protein
MLVNIIYEEDFEDFCRVQFEQVNVVLSLLGIANDETFSDFKERNYLRLEVEYLDSIGKLSIH